VDKSTAQFKSSIVDVFETWFNNVS
jgi:hypothetical protein